MDKNQKKQVMKRIRGLEEQIRKHKEKVSTLIGRKDTTKDYWQKEIEQMENQVQELKEKLE
jgi:aspartate/tyrosine/aromatic aminotransferase